MRPRIKVEPIRVYSTVHRYVGIIAKYQFEDELKEFRRKRASRKLIFN